MASTTTATAPPTRISSPPRPAAARGLRGDWATPLPGRPGARHLPGGRRGPTDPTCDGVDDDCNGAVDDGYAATPTRCGLGACASIGLMLCRAGALVDDCKAGLPTGDDTDCDDVDDDCDGAVDEAFAGDALTCGVGVCEAAGVSRCVAGVVEADCRPSEPLDAFDARCDGRDEDCDGRTDEDFEPIATACGRGVCAREGLTLCVDGQELSGCAPGTPTGDDRDCNGLDDDCDGVVDDGYVPVTVDCGVGVCARTSPTLCEDGQIIARCVPGEPSPEDTTCDGRDDDCDGRSDEDVEVLPMTCGTGACQADGQRVCLDGASADLCVPGRPAANDADCDGVDDDCDGQTDEDFVGAPTTCGVGACAARGVEVCRDGRRADTCVAAPAGADDATCDGRDDDCDGTADEDFVVTPTRCGVGACAAGRRAHLRRRTRRGHLRRRPPHRGCRRRHDLRRPRRRLRRRRGRRLPRRPDRLRRGRVRRRRADGLRRRARDRRLRAGPARRGGHHLRRPRRRLRRRARRGLHRRPDAPAARAPASPAATDALPRRTGRGRLPSGRAGVGRELRRRRRRLRRRGGRRVRRRAGRLRRRRPRHRGARDLPGRPRRERLRVPGAPRADDATCDGRDDDCDGRLDEDFAGGDSTCGRGVCASAGERTCRDGRVFDSCPPAPPWGTTAPATDATTTATARSTRPSSARPCAAARAPARRRRRDVLRDGAVVDLFARRPGGRRRRLQRPRRRLRRPSRRGLRAGATCCGSAPAARPARPACVTARSSTTCTPGAPRGRRHDLRRRRRGLRRRGRRGLRAGHRPRAVRAPAWPRPGGNVCEAGAIAACVHRGRLARAARRRPATASTTTATAATDEDYVAATAVDPADSAPASATASTCCVDGARSRLRDPARGADDATCDGVDDDCDGQVDEDYVAAGRRPAAIGACRRDGVDVCVAGAVADACAPARPGGGRRDLRRPRRRLRRRPRRGLRRDRDDLRPGRLRRRGRTLLRRGPRRDDLHPRAADRRARHHLRRARRGLRRPPRRGLRRGADHLRRGRLPCGRPRAL